MMVLNQYTYMILSMIITHISLIIYFIYMIFEGINSTLSTSGSVFCPLHSHCRPLLFILVASWLQFQAPSTFAQGIHSCIKCHCSSKVSICPRGTAHKSLEHPSAAVDIITTKTYLKI